MAIPGYDPADIETAVTCTDDETGARVDVVAGLVPEEFDVGPSDRDRPDDAVSALLELRGVDGLAGVETVRIALSYEPSAIPADASPDDVTLVAVRPDGRRRLDSTVHREAETVSAECSGELPGSTVVAVVER